MPKTFQFHRLASLAALLALGLACGTQLHAQTSLLPNSKGLTTANTSIGLPALPGLATGTKGASQAFTDAGLTADPARLTLKPGLENLGSPKPPAHADASQEAKPSQPAAEPTPTAAAEQFPAADEIEFQRFVRSATGQALKLYGYELFANPSSYSAVQAAPVPAGYILGPGDELVVQVNGLAEINERLVIDRDGRVAIPKAGPLRLAGVPFSDAEKTLTAHLGRVFRNFTVSVSMGRLRSIEVFVVGQARKPGKHLVSSLSSLVNALFETGGPSANGSLRGIELRRGGKKLANVDMYAFLARGESGADVQLLAGDIIYIPPAGPRAALLGTINAPAIYELRAGETINDVLSLSGGLPTLAAPQKAQLDRVDANQEIARYVQELALDAKGLGLPLKAGDILTVLQVRPEIGNVVTLQGNVAWPLRYTFKPGMRVSDLLSDRRLLIPGSYWEQINRGASAGTNYSRPEVNLDYATIQRLDRRTLRTDTIAFNLLKAISREQTEDLELKSGDIVTVYKPQDPGPETQDSITITGEVVGGTKRFVWRPGFTIKDIIPSAQWLVDYYSYWQRPSARNLRNDINWEYAQVIRRVPDNLSTKAVTFNLGNAVLKGSAADNLRLEPGDQIALFTTAQQALPLEKRVQMVTLTGEVNVPGQYQLQPGETLPALVRRAGGLTGNAFSYGIVFTRESTRQQQQENLNKSIRRLESDISAQTASALQNVTDTEKGSALQAQIAGQKILLDRLKNLKASGRVTLDLDPARPVLPALTLEDGDQITVPSQPNFVGVFGEVLAESAFIHRPAYTVADYLDKAGVTRDADLDNLMLIRADGSVEGSARRASMWFSSGLTAKRLNPGDTIFVPGTIDRRTAYSQIIQGAKDWTAILYQFGLGAAALKSIRSIN
jgi:protein involved in polysaccharide export with SLBB domain